VRTWITNATELASTPHRRDALALMDAGLEAIETEAIIERTVSMDGGRLTVGAHRFDLAPFKRICLIGLGKTACPASQGLRRILGDRISSEVIIESAKSPCGRPGHLPATHPLPSAQNVAHTHTLLEACADLKKDDLVLVIVSGGGSAMLCGTDTEYKQGQRLYADALRTGMTIHELNVVRKHLSELKGGGLAHALYPAQIIGLIFSDVPGTAYDMVASGPTWPDPTTIRDAQAALGRYDLTGYTLQETPKEPQWFERITNIVLASNRIALEAMAQQATMRGYGAHILSDALYDDSAHIITRMRKQASPRTAILSGGEFRIIVTKKGKGGRNTQATLTALDLLADDELFIALASDGLDNTDAAGAIADLITYEKARTRELDATIALEEFESYPFFEKTGDLIFTGPTEANVSDLMLLLKE